jgi:hypothetical protein
MNDTNNDFFELRCNSYKHNCLFYFAIALNCNVPILEALFHTTLSELHCSSISNSNLRNNLQCWFREYCMQFLVTRLGPSTETFGLNRGFRCNGYLLRVGLMQSEQTLNPDILFKVVALQQRSPSNWYPFCTLTIAVHCNLVMITFLQRVTAKHFYDVGGGLLERLDDMLVLLQ